MCVGRGGNKGLWCNSQGLGSGRSQSRVKKNDRDLTEKRLILDNYFFFFLLGHEIYANWLAGKLASTQIK